MSEKRECLAGHDDGESLIGFLLLAAIVIIIAIIVCIIIIYGGFFIGGFHSIKNYIISFKHNVIDSNMAAA
ncbi:MAG: hypothetical protein LUC97_08680 [Clostridiales bacterium]|nr:hypothetical protein [Clostridiales bacterium]